MTGSREDEVCASIGKLTGDHHGQRRDKTVSANEPDTIRFDAHAGVIFFAGG